MDNLTGRKISRRHTPTIVNTVTKDHHVAHKFGEPQKSIGTCEDCGCTCYYGLVGRRYYRMLTNESACNG